MKKILIIFALCLAGALYSGSVYAQSGNMSELDSYSQAFDTATNLAEQLIYIRYVADGNYEGADDFWAKALNRLVMQYPDLSTRTDIYDADTAAMIVSRKVGDAKIASASANLLTLVNSSTPSAQVKAEALMALGQIGDPLYLPHIIRVLTDLNNLVNPNSEVKERSENIASGAIQALDYFGSPQGYLPVFFVYTGWYNQRIRNAAEVVMGHLMDDPADPMIEVITTSGYTYDEKYTALQVTEKSRATEEDKARVAVAALTEGWRNQVSDIHQREVLVSMRKDALRMIRRYGTNDSAVYPQIDRSYTDRNSDIYEKQEAIDTLKALATEDSVQYLTSYLRAIHQRRLTNTITPNDELLVRAIIPALGSIGGVARSICQPVLLQIENATNGWGSAVRLDAKNALDRIGR